MHSQLAYVILTNIKSCLFFRVDVKIASQNKYMLHA